MAYWKIAFKSRLGTDYEVRIAGLDANNDVNLTGGDVPFYIQEDDSCDIFKPIRLQTGYIHFIDTDNATWKAMMPTTAVDRPVYLYSIGDNTETLLWSGFIKPETYSGKLYQIPQEREFPIVCRMSVMDSYEFPSYLATRVLPLYQILGRIITSIPSEVAFSNVYFQGGELITTWLESSINSKVLFDYSQDGEYLPKYTNLELLKEICKFFGWTARTYGDSIFFTSSDDPNLFSWMYGFPCSDLQSGIFSNGDYLYVYPLSTSVWTISANSTEEYMQGYKRAVITADIGKFDYVMDGGDIEEIVKGATINDDLTEYYYYYHREEESLDDEQVGEMIVNTNPDAGYFQQYDYHKGTYDLSIKTYYDWTSVIHVCSSNSTEIPMTFETLGMFNFSNGIIVLSAETEAISISGGELSTYPGNGVIYYRLVVGDYVYNQTDASWVLAENDDSWSELEIGEDHTHDRSLIGTEGTTGTIVTNRYLNMPYPAFDGHGIAVPGTLAGRIRLEIKECSLVGGLTSVNLKDLKITFYRNNNYAKHNERENNIYTVESGVDFCDSYSVETFIATDDGNAAGNSILLNSSGSFLTTLPYGVDETADVTERPEYHLANRIGNAYGSQAHHVMRLEILNPYTSEHIVPYSDLIVFDDNNNRIFYTPVSITRDFYNDIINVIYIEVNIYNN